MQKNLVFIQNLNQGNNDIQQIQHIQSKLGLKIQICTQVSEFDKYDLDQTVLIAFHDNSLYQLVIACRYDVQTIFFKFADTQISQELQGKIDKDQHNPDPNILIIPCEGSKNMYEQINKVMKKTQFQAKIYSIPLNLKNRGTHKMIFMYPLFVMLPQIIKMFEAQLKENMARKKLISNVLGKAN